MTVLGGCPDCGSSIEVVAIAEGEVVWIECVSCGRTVYGMARADAPSLILFAAVERAEEA